MAERPTIMLEGGPLHGYRVPRSEGEHPLTYPCDATTKPRTRDIVFPVQDGPLVVRAVYAPTGRYIVEFVHDTPIYAHVAA